MVRTEASGPSAGPGAPADRTSATVHTPVDSVQGRADRSRTGTPDLGTVATDGPQAGTERTSGPGTGTGAVPRFGDRSPADGLEHVTVRTGGPQAGTGPLDGPHALATVADGPLRSAEVAEPFGDQARTGTPVLGTVATDDPQARTAAPDGPLCRSTDPADGRSTGPQFRSAGLGGQQIGDGPQARTGPVDGPPDQSGPNADQAVRADQGASLLDELRSAFAKFVVLPSAHALDAATLWAAASHLQPAWQHAPRLAVVGPAKRCGKSRLLDIITETVHDPLITVNASLPAVFRSITEDPPTLLVDEADTLFGSTKAAERNEELRGVLNAGHQRNRPVVRMVGNGPEMKPGKFPTFAMAALAGIGDLPDTIMDRSVVIRMRRRVQARLSSRSDRLSTSVRCTICATGSPHGSSRFCPRWWAWCRTCR